MTTATEKKLLAQANAAMDRGETDVAIDIGDLLELMHQISIARKASTLIAKELVQTVSRPNAV